MKTTLILSMFNFGPSPGPNLRTQVQLVREFSRPPADTLVFAGRFFPWRGTGCPPSVEKLTDNNRPYFFERKLIVNKWVKLVICWEV